MIANEKEPSGNGEGGYDQGVLPCCVSEEKGGTGLFLHEASNSKAQQK
jgi:hypothetical protein